MNSQSLTLSYQLSPSSCHDSGHESCCALPSSPTYPGSTVLTDERGWPSPQKYTRMKPPDYLRTRLNPKNHACRWIQTKPTKRARLTSYNGTQDPATTSRVTIDILPDLALLELFNFYVNEAGRIEKWQTLVHVCRRWRQVVFGSPRRLGLQLLCTARKRVRETLDVWPPLPIVIRHGWLDVDNIVPALKHADRVCEIRLWPVPSSHWETVLATMEQPFPELTDLKLQSKDETAPILLDSFLGGFAPRLRSLRFERIPYPGLPNLLSSATGLVKISLQKIPHSGYISPKAMVTCLSTLTSLEELEISFMSPPSYPNRESRPSPPFTCSILPALRHFVFGGVSEYLEDLVARIDSPSLDSLEIKFFHQLIFDTPQLTRFISRTPMLKASNNAHIDISNSGVSVLVRGVVGRGLRLEISCRPSDWQLSSLAQVCSSFPQTLISSLVHLYIYHNRYSRPRWQDDIENCQWLELLQPFTAVQNLHVSVEFAPRITPALQELVREKMTGVLPALQYLCLEEDNAPGPIREAIIDVYSPRFILNQ